MLILLPSDLISDFFQNMNFYHLFPEVSRQGSLPPWMLPLIFNPGKHEEMRPWWSVFLAPLRAIFSSFQAAEEGGGSRSPAPWSLVPAAWEQSQGKGNQLLLFPWATHCTPCLQWAFLGGRHFSVLSLTPDSPWGCLGLYVPLLGGKTPHSTFWPFEKCITKIQFCSACCLHMLTMAFAVQPCGTLKALSLECLCV